MAITASRWWIMIIMVLVNSQNTYIGDDDTYWQSTSPFTPINSSHTSNFGQIRLREEMKVSIAVTWFGRTQASIELGKYEQIFRVGWPATAGSCSTANSRYPSLWIDNIADSFHLSISDDVNCGRGHTLSNVTILPNIEYVVDVEFSTTHLLCSINHVAVLDVEREWSQWTKFDGYLDELMNVYISSDNYQTPYVRANVSISNLSIWSIVPTSAPTPATETPTQTPTAATDMPSTTPTGVPSVHPTTNTPTSSPTSSPTTTPTEQPSWTPTDNPSTAPPTSTSPSYLPSTTPTRSPTRTPVAETTLSPETSEPTTSTPQLPLTTTSDHGSLLTSTTIDLSVTATTTQQQPTLSTTDGSEVLVTGSDTHTTNTPQSSTAQQTDSTLDIRIRQDDDNAPISQKELLYLLIAGVASCCLGTLLIWFAVRKCAEVDKGSKTLKSQIFGIELGIGRKKTLDPDDHGGDIENIADFNSTRLHIPLKKPSEDEIYNRSRKKDVPRVQPPPNGHSHVYSAVPVTVDVVRTGVTIQRDSEREYMITVENVDDMDTENEHDIEEEEAPSEVQHAVHGRDREEEEEKGIILMAKDPSASTYEAETELVTNSGSTLFSRISPSQTATMPMRQVQSAPNPKQLDLVPNPMQLNAGYFPSQSHEERVLLHLMNNAEIVSEHEVQSTASQQPTPVQYAYYAPNTNPSSRSSLPAHVRARIMHAHIPANGNMPHQLQQRAHDGNAVFAAIDLLSAHPNAQADAGHDHDNDHDEEDTTQLDESQLTAEDNLRILDVDEDGDSLPVLPATLPSHTINDGESVTTWSNDHKRVDLEKVPEENMLSDGYSWIKVALMEVDDDWKIYFSNFKRNKVTESRLRDLKSADLKELIPKIGPRNEFENLLKQRLIEWQDVEIESNKL